MSTFVKNTVLLILAAFIGECLELLINILLARELGEEGLGLYMAIFPTVLFLVIIASMEIPISLSKYIAEQQQSYHQSILQHTIRFTTAMTIVFLILALVVFPIIPVFHSYHPLISWMLLLLIPIISFSSIARGYFMGIHHMGKIALSNIIRRVVQFILLVAVYQFFQFETELSILVALCTLIGAEVVVLLYLITKMMLQLNVLKRNTRSEMASEHVRKALVTVSLPTTGLRIFYAASFAVKPFLIKAALMNAGVVEQMAIVQYGKLAGVAFTIGFFPAFIAHSLLTVLIPTVSEAYSQREMGRLQQLFRKMMLVTCCYALPSAWLFYFFADPLINLFFDASSASIYLQLLVPYFFFHFFVIPIQAFLIGLGLVKDAFLHSIWSTTISFALIVGLGSLPQLQMDGVIIGMNTGAVLLTLMHYLTIRHKLTEPQAWRLSEVKKNIVY